MVGSCARGASRLIVAGMAVWVFAAVAALLVGPRAVADGFIDASDLAPLGKDFRQAANEDPVLGDAHWINSILQQSNSLYYEGVSVPQRAIFVDIPPTSGNSHTLNFSHQATKGLIHAYDFLTSWEQAVAAADAIAPGQNLLVNLFSMACGPEIGPEATTAICNGLRTGGNSILVNVPDVMGSVAGDNIDTRIAAYEACFGNRTIKLYGNQPITSATVTFNGFTLLTLKDLTVGGDFDALYTLQWTSSSTQVLIEVGGHISVGADSAACSGVGYGVGRGASGIGGGPYHFKLTTLDGASLGSQDNQISGADVMESFCVEGITEPGGLCYDGNPCTTDECDELNDVCVHNPLPMSTACESDFNLCTIEHCNGSGACVHYDDVVCQSPVPPCEGGEYCDPATGLCNTIPDAPYSTSCEMDGNLCTIDHCNGSGACVTYDDVDCPGPVPPCEGGQYCNPATGQCASYPDAPSSTPCEADGNLCTIDHCNGNGSCVTHDNVDCQDPVPPCEGGQYCDPATGQCVNNPDAQLSTPCNVDGDLCTIDHCDGNGACVTYDYVHCQSAVPPCEAGEVCNPSSGQCEALPDAGLSTPCEADGNLCTVDHCNGSGGCVTYDNVDCQPANPPCEGGQYCDPATGQCVNNPDAPLSTACEADGNLCTIDHCNGSGACVTYDNVQCPTANPPCGSGEYCEPSTGQCVPYGNAPVSTPCDLDNNWCTGEHCDGNGACVDYPPYDVDCQDAIPPCEGGQYCEPATGQCINNPDALISTQCEADGNLCTIDHCDGSGICVTYDQVDCPGSVLPCEAGTQCNPATGQCDALPDAPLSTPCEADGNLCTIDHCNGSGACVTYDDVDCQDPVPPCEGGEVCNSATGQCVALPDAPWSTPCEADGNLCTIDHCDGNGACVTYDYVECQGPVPPCEAGEQCNPATGLCESLPDAPMSTPCENDFNLCTIEHCSGGGACVHYSDVDCEDPVPPCEGGEYCVPATGQCIPLPDAPLSTACEADGNLCTIDHCNGTGTCVTYNNVVCQDPVPPCEGGQYCNPATGGCVNNPDAPLSTSCEFDGNLCTIDHCDGTGACVTYNNVVCQNPVPPCEGGEQCNPATGNCDALPDAALSTPCEVDGNLCTIDHCNGSGVCVTYNNVVCQNPVPPCEGGQHCNPANGQCVNDPDGPLSTACELDGNLCTIDHCNGSGACVTYNNVVCQNPVPPCEGGQRCDPANGQCLNNPDAPLSTPCDKDGNVCTQDHCDGSGQCVFLNAICGACCYDNGSCAEGITQDACTAAGGSFKGVGRLCAGDSDGDGKDDLCVPPIPAVTEWGLAALAMMLLSGAKVYFGRRRGAVDSAEN